MNSKFYLLYMGELKTIAQGRFLPKGCRPIDPYREHKVPFHNLRKLAKVADNHFWSIKKC
jgi:hypothetical protein